MAPGSFLASRVESMGDVGAAATMVAAKMAKMVENCMLAIEGGKCDEFDVLYNVISVTVSA